MAREGGERLESWKEIASYLSSSVRTVQRWEKTEGLPVQRHHHEKLGSIYALVSEVDAWLEGRARAGAAAAAAPNRGRPDVTSDVPDWRARVGQLRDQLDADRGATLDDPSDAASRPTVGRRAERASVLEGFETAIAERSQVLCLAGEPGIGKTTLLHDFLGDLRAAGRAHTVAHGHCSERLAGSEAYLAVLDALDSLLHGPSREVIAELMRLVAPTWYVRVAPLWATADPAFERIAEEGRAASRERMKRELAALFDELAQVRPLILVLDDMHWADPSTVELLAYLAKRPGARGLLIVGAYRPTELLLGEHPFLEVKQELQARGLCREVPIGFLSLDDVGVYLDARFPGHDFPPELAKLVHARTEGSPLFMADLLGEFERQGRITRGGGGWSLVSDTGDFEDELPESVRSMVQRKIDQLDDGDRALLGAAAVQGHEFESAVVARATGRRADEVETRLERLGRVHALVRLLHESELPGAPISLRYAFVHVLYQNSLHGSLTPTRRVELSRAVAESLEALHAGRTGTVASELALLYEEARDHVRAADFFIDAARNAAALFANDEGVALSQRAIEHAESLPDAERYPRVLAAALELAQLKKVLGRYEEALAAFELADRTGANTDDVTSRVEAICGIANALFFLKRTEQSLEQGKRAVALAKESGTELDVANAESVVARGYLCSGDFAEAESRYDWAIPRLREEGGAQAMDAVGFRILLHAWRLEHEEVDAAARRWLAAARAQGFPVTQMLFYTAMSSGNRGRWTEALRDAEESVRLADLNDDPYHICRLPNVMGWIYGEIGDEDRAFALDTESVQLARELEFEEAEANAHVNLAQTHTSHGEFDRALEHMDAAEALFKRDVWFRWRYAIRLGAARAEYALAKGDLASARDHATRTLEQAEYGTARKHVAGAHHHLGRIAVLEDRISDADKHFTRALAAIRDHPCPSLEWRILESQAGLATAQHQTDRARELRGRVKARADELARAIEDDALRATFESSKRVRDL